MEKRIWELDALRGLGILGMILSHLAYDLIVLYGVWCPKSTALFDFVQSWGGMLFLVLSGICVTLGSRHIRRGLLVFLCGMAVSAATGLMYLMGLADESILIYFGVLHCLGCCMLLWPVFRKYPAWLLLALGVILAVLGLYLVRNVSVSFPWLIPLGIPSHSFTTSDYFPLLPNLGYFLAGAAIGKWVYREKKSLLPKVNTQTPALHFLCFCGRHSLLIYLLHQPVLAGSIGLCLLLTR